MTEISLRTCYTIVGSFFKHFEGNFLKATNKSLPLMVVFVNSVLAKNRKKMKWQKIHFVDSTPVEVCKNSKIPRHRVAREYASRGKSTKGVLLPELVSRVRKDPPYNVPGHFLSHPAVMN